MTLITTEIKTPNEGVIFQGVISQSGFSISLLLGDTLLKFQAILYYSSHQSYLPTYAVPHLFPAESSDAVLYKFQTIIFILSSSLFVPPPS